MKNVFKGILWLFCTLMITIVLFMIASMIGIEKLPEFMLVYWIMCFACLRKASVCFAEAVGKNHSIIRGIIMFLPMIYLVFGVMIYIETRVTSIVSKACIVIVFIVLSVWKARKAKKVQSRKA